MSETRLPTRANEHTSTPTQATNGRRFLAAGHTARIQNKLQAPCQDLTTARGYRPPLPLQQDHMQAFKRGLTHHGVVSLIPPHVHAWTRQPPRHPGITTSWAGKCPLHAEQFNSSISWLALHSTMVTTCLASQRASNLTAHAIHHHSNISSLVWGDATGTCKDVTMYLQRAVVETRRCTILCSGSFIGEHATTAPSNKPFLYKQLQSQIRAMGIPDQAQTSTSAVNGVT